MAIHWEKILTDPLGLSGYALFLVFGVVALVVKQRKPRDRWIVPAGFVLGAVCVIGGLSLAYLRQPAATVAPPTAPPTSTTPAPSMHIDKVDQKVDNGNAVTGVQGNVTITSNPPPKSSKPRR